MQVLILLSKIQSEDSGITGYQLQEMYDLPRGTLIRILQDLENKEFVTTQEEIVNGRANKFYTLSETGEKHLENLRVKWAERSEILDDLAPFERYGMGQFRQTMHHHGAPIPPVGGPHPPFNRRHSKRRLGRHGSPLDARNDLLEVILNQIENFRTKDEAIDFLRGHRSRLTHTINRLESRLKDAQGAKTEIDELISQIEDLIEFTPEQIETLFKTS